MTNETHTTNAATFDEHVQQRERMLAYADAYRGATDPDYWSNEAIDGYLAGAFGIGS